MTEQKIWEIALPDVTVEDLFQAEGADYSKRPPGQVRWNYTAGYWRRPLLWFAQR